MVRNIANHYDWVDGFDFCYLQGDIDFLKAYMSAAGPNRPGMRFCYIQSSRYSSTRDHRFPKYLEQATEAGLYVGAYHFIAVFGEPEAQAEFFYKACEGQGSRAGELPPMVDFEYVTKTGPKEAVAWVERFVKAVDKLWYPDNAVIRKCYGVEGLGLVPQHKLDENSNQQIRQPLLYTYPYFSSRMQPYLGESILTDLPLCMAFYGAKMQPWYPNPVSQRPPLPTGWKDWKLWQYSGNKGMKVPGVIPDCDRLLFNGTEDDLRAFAGLPPTLASGGDNVTRP